MTTIMAPPSCTVSTQPAFTRSLEETERIEMCLARLRDVKQRADHRFVSCSPVTRTKSSSSKKRSAVKDIPPKAPPEVPKVKGRKRHEKPTNKKKKKATRNFKVRFSDSPPLEYVSPFDMEDIKDCWMTSKEVKEIAKYNRCLIRRQFSKPSGLDTAESTTFLIQNVTGFEQSDDDSVSSMQELLCDISYHSWCTEDDTQSLTSSSVTSRRSSSVCSTVPTNDSFSTLTSGSTLTSRSNSASQDMKKRRQTVVDMHVNRLVNVSVNLRGLERHFVPQLVGRHRQQVRKTVLSVQEKFKKNNTEKVMGKDYVLEQLCKQSQLRSQPLRQLAFHMAQVDEKVLQRMQKRIVLD